MGGGESSSSASSSGETRPVVPLKRFGDYEILEELGRGSMGVVYKARQVSLNRTVAIKMILSGEFASNESVARFRREAEVSAELNHPNITTIYETGEIDGMAYYSMDFVEGRTLAEMADNQPLDWKVAARYAKQIAAAVQYAHERGVLHRDLKPHNVIIDPFDQPRIMDFGLARKMDMDSGFTLSTSAIGSPSYMPPEQALGQHAQVGPRSDVYGIGAILYELLTIRPPVMAGTVAKTLEMVVNSEPIPPRRANPSIPDDLNTVVLKCLEKDPDKRYHTAGTVAEELDRVIEDKPIVAKPVSTFGHAWRWCRRNRRLAALSVFTLLLLVASSIVSTVLWLNARAALTEAENQTRRAEHAQLRTEKALSEAENSRQQAIQEMKTAQDALQKMREAQQMAARQTKRAERAAASKRTLEEKLEEESARAQLAAAEAEVLKAQAGLSEVPDRVIDAMGALTVEKPNEALAYLAAHLREAPEDTTAASQLLSLIASRSWSVPRAALNHKAEETFVDVQFSADRRKVLARTFSGRLLLWDLYDPETKVQRLRKSGKVHHAIISDDGAEVALVHGQKRRPEISLWRPLEDDLIDLGRLPEELDPQWARPLEFQQRGRVLLVVRESANAAAVTPETGESPNLPAGELAAIDTVKIETLWSQPFAGQNTRFLPQKIVQLPRQNSLLSASGGGMIYWQQSSPVKPLWLRSLSPQGASSATIIREIGVCHDAANYVLWRENPEDNRSVIEFGSLETGQPWGATPLEGALLEDVQIDNTGRLAATFDENGLITLWNTRTLTPVTSWATRNQETAGRVALAPAAALILPGDGTAFLRKLWNPSHPGFFPRLPQGPMNGVLNKDQSLAVIWPDFPNNDAQTPDAAAQNRRKNDAPVTSLVFDVQQKHVLPMPLPHGPGLEAIRFSPDGSRLLTLDDQGLVKLWDSRSGELLQSYDPLKSPVEHAAFSPGGRFFALATEDGRVITVDTYSTSRPVTLRSGDTRFTALEFSRDGSLLAAAAEDRMRYVWSISSRQRIELQEPALAGEEKRDQAEVEAGEADGATDTQENATTSRRNRPEGTTREQAASLAERARRARLQDPQAHLPAMLRFPGNLLADRMIFSQDGRYLATIAPVAVHIYDLTTREHVLGESAPDMNFDGKGFLEAMQRLGGALFVRQVEAASLRLVEASSQDVHLLWNAAAWKVQRSGLDFGQPAQHIMFSPDAARLFVATGETAQVWDARTGEMLTRELPHTAEVSRGAFDAGAGRLATATADGRAWVWDIGYGLKLIEPLDHDGLIDDLALSPDGRFLVTASEEGVARILEIPRPTGQAPGWLPAWAEALAGVRITANGLPENIEDLYGLWTQTRATMQEQIDQLRTRPTANGDSAENDWSTWADWFLTTGPDRRVSPGLTLNPEELRDRALFTGLLSDLLRARLFHPNDQELEDRIYTPDRWYRRAQALEQQGRINESLRCVRQALALAPNDPRFTALESRLVNLARATDPRSL